MSRYFMIQSWVGSHENEPDYNGQQCGERNVRSSEVVPLYDQYGMANVSAFSDEAIAERTKKPVKPKRSIAEKILPQSVRYDNLCNLMSELESQKGSMCSEDYYQYHAILKAKIDRQWILLSKAAGWTEHLPENPVKKSAQTSTQNTHLLHENEAKNDDSNPCVLSDEQNMFYTPVKLFCKGINFYKSLDKAWKDGIYFISASTMMLIGFKVLF